MKLRVILLVLALTGCVSTARAEGLKFDDWTRGDGLRTAVFGIVHMVDWLQTLEAIKDPYRFSETNPSIGARPSRGEVNQHFLLTGIATATAFYFLPPDYRRPFQYLSIGYEFSRVQHNHWVGVRISF